MNEFEDIELSEQPTRSIASLDYEFLANEQPPVVTYKSVTGYLLRHRCEDEHELLALTMTEFNECIKLNTPAEEDIQGGG